MAQNLQDVKSTDYIDDGLIKLLNRDMCALTCMSGEELPENTDEGLFHNNLTDRYFYTNEDGVWKKVLYYKRPYFNKTYMETHYQQLNENLTKFSEQTPLNDSFIAYDTVVSFSTYFRNTILYESSPTALSTSIGLGKISTLNGISNVYLKENSIPPEKLQNSLATTPQFYPGDICLSFNKSGKANFIKLAVGVTVGNNASGANYVGPRFKDLFVALWNNPDLQLQNMRGVITNRGESPEVDWNTNCRMCLPDSPKKYDNTVGLTIFNSTSGSKTFTVTVPGYYHVTLIGGGGGGWAFCKNYSAWWRGASAGGSGASFSGYVYFPVGTYTVTVGSAGTSDATADDRWSRSTAGGNTSISGVITAGGGGAGKGCGRNTFWDAGDTGYSVGTGGKLTFHNPSKHPVSTTILSTNGNNGSGTGCGKNAYSYTGGASTSTSLGFTYGKGSKAAAHGRGNTEVETPGGGYARVGYMGFYPPNSNNSNNINDQKFFQDLVFYMKY